MQIAFFSYKYKLSNQYKIERPTNSHKPNKNKHLQTNHAIEKSAKSHNPTPNTKSKTKTHLNQKKTKPKP